MNVEVVLLRQLAAEVALKPGTVLAARVLDRGAISLAGVRLAATLPDGLEPGAALRLRVREASPERLVLQVVDRPEAPAAAPGSTGTPLAGLALPLPGGATAQLLVDPDDGQDGAGGAGGRRHSLTLRYESDRLGRVDLAIAVEPAAVSAVAHAPAGAVAEHLRAGVPELRDALAQALGRPAQVGVVARGETLNVRA